MNKYYDRKNYNLETFYRNLRLNLFKTIKFWKNYFYYCIIIKLNALKLHLKKITLVVICMIFLSEAKSQDPIYSQFTHNPIYYNPAYVGLHQGMRVRLNYRKQWPNLPGDYNSYNFNMDMAVREIPGSGGIGLLFDKHSAGTGYFERVKVGIPISVRIPLYENLLIQMGLMTSLVQKSLDWNNLVFMDQLDPRFGNIYPTSFTPPSNGKITYPDFDIGIALRWFASGYKGMEYVFTTGIAVHHVFTPNESFFDLDAPLPRRFVFTGDVIIQNEYFERAFNTKKRSPRDFRFNPGFIFESQEKFKSLSLGFNAYKSNLYAGLWYRAEDLDFTKSNAMVIMAGVSAYLNNDTKVKFLYSYDMLLSKAYSRAAGGTHEISVIFELDTFSLFGESNPYQRRRKRTYLETQPF